jgi:hypothetical protein
VNKNLIQKFLIQSCWDEQDEIELEDWINVEKFAELIVRECANIALREDHDPSDCILKHFGVER